MTELKSTKSNFLLEAPLDILHEESIEWMEEIEFWKDEFTFFHNLIVGKIRKASSELKSKEEQSVENHLVAVSAEKLDGLKIEVQEHERFLSNVLDNVSLNGQDYRFKHRVISEKFYAFEQEFRNMKRQVFNFAKKTPGNLTS